MVRKNYLWAHNCNHKIHISRYDLKNALIVKIREEKSLVKLRKRIYKPFKNKQKKCTVLVKIKRKTQFTDFVKMHKKLTFTVNVILINRKMSILVSTKDANLYDSFNIAIKK